MHWLTEINQETDEELLRQGEVYRTLANPILAVLSALWLIVLFAPELFDLSSTAETLTKIVDGLMWAIFVVDLLIRIALAPNDRLKWGLIGPLIVVLSVPVAIYTVNDRFSYILRTIFFTIVVLRALGTVRYFLRQRSILYLIVAEGVVIVIFGMLITAVERDAPGTTIHSLQDGLWWAVVTVATVGYGDTHPVTGEGRLVGVGLIVLGVAMFSILTASLAKLFVLRDETMIASRLQEIHEQLDTMQGGQRTRISARRTRIREGRRAQQDRRRRSRQQVGKEEAIR
jgi:voltage-gated potassium channel Kch